MIQTLQFRLNDSLPAKVIGAWKNELAIRPDSERSVELRRRIETYLDAGHGSCFLRRGEIAQLMEGALFYFDEKRYRLLGWCIMPNHVHAVIETRNGFALPEILHSWKSYTTHQANKLLRRTGELWEREYFDRYVRNAEHYAKVMAYVEENPVKAGLCKLKTDWAWSSARLRADPGSGGVSSASFPPPCS